MSGARAADTGAEVRFGADRRYARVADTGLRVVADTGLRVIRQVRRMHSA